MKTFKLSKANSLFTEDDIFKNLDKLLSKYGMNFKIEYDGKIVPIIVKKRVDDKEAVYRVSIAYPQTSSMIYPTLSISFGTDDDPSIADINFVHKNGDYGLSGTYIVNLAVRFLKLLGVKLITLTDAASIYDKQAKCHLQLTPYLLLKKSTTFYGKFGFKPYNSNIYNTSYENDDQSYKILCQRVKEIQKLRVSSFLNHLNKVEKLLNKVGDNPNLIMLYTETDFKRGIPKEQNFEDASGDNATDVLKIIAKITTSLEKYRSLTVVEMMQHCSCTEFRSLLNYFHRLPSIITYKSTKLKHKYQSLFQEMAFIIFRSDYVLDLTQPLDKVSC